MVLTEVEKREESIKMSQMCVGGQRQSFISMLRGALSAANSSDLHIISFSIQMSCHSAEYPVICKRAGD